MLLSVIIVSFMCILRSVVYLSARLLYTANEYFATAASYLSTINNFGPSTLLEGPFNKVQFLINGEATRMNISLRKKYAINGDNTLLLVHRSRAKWTSATQAGILAGMPVDVMDGGVTRPL